MSRRRDESTGGLACAGAASEVWEETFSKRGTANRIGVKYTVERPSALVTRVGDRDSKKLLKL